MPCLRLSIVALFVALSTPAQTPSRVFVRLLAPGGRLEKPSVRLVNVQSGKVHESRALRPDDGVRLSDAAGHVMVIEVPPGRYAISARDLFRAPEPHPPLEVSESRVFVTLELTLRPPVREWDPSRVTPGVLRSHGVPLAGTWIRIAPAYGIGAWEAVTDSSGAFEVPRLANGSYLLTVQAGDTPRVLPFTVRSSEPLALDLPR